MKTVIQAVAALVIVAASVGTAVAQSRAYFGPTGGYTGSSFTSGTTTNYYGPTGGYVGSSTRN